MEDSRIDINNDQSSEVPVEANGRVNRGTQTSSPPGHRFWFGSLKELGAGPLRKFRQRCGHVNRRPDSSRPTKKADDQVGTRPRDSSQPTENEDDQVGIRPQCDSSPEMSKAHVPQMVSLGPCHELPHETIKSNILRISDEDDRFKDLVLKMTRDNDRIRDWYASCGCRSSDKDLGRMMARDGLFLLQFLREISRRSECIESSFTNSFKDTLTSSLPLRPFAVQEDVMKIHNQIPMFVLQKILQWEADCTYEWEAAKDLDLNSILRHAWVNLSPIRYSCYSQDSQSKAGAGATVRDDWHLLWFVYEKIIPSSDSADSAGRNKRRKKKRGDNRITLPSAADLRANGVKFNENKGPLDKIHFDGRNRTLYLPAIKMNGATDVVLRNLVTFEATLNKEKKPLLCYVDMMERLINTADDVEVLRKCGIIESHLSTDDDVATIWNGMRDLLSENIEYEPINNVVHDVITFCTRKHRVMYVEFKRKYCSKPWIVISVISACMLLVLTVLQTILAWEQVSLQLKSMNNVSSPSPPGPGNPGALQ